MHVYVQVTVTGISCVFTASLKRALSVEIEAWKMLYGRPLNTIYKAKMEHINVFEEDINRRLSHPIKDLEDVRIAMATLELVKLQQIEIDFMLSPIEVCSSTPFFKCTRSRTV